jgi:hypothetical protein
MGGAFEDREKAFEDKWAHDQELRFKIAARRNKLVGLWAAGELGLSGKAAEDYAKSVVATDLQATGHDVFRKIRGDFDAAKLTHSDRVLRDKMEELLAAATDQIVHEVKG